MKSVFEDSNTSEVFGNSENLEKIRQSFLERLNSIKSKRVTVDTIDIYTEEVLGELIRLTDDVTSSYAEELGVVKDSGREFEDRAYSHYDLLELSELLDKAQRKAEEMLEISQFINNRVVKKEEIIIPPDTSPRVISGSGEGIAEPTFTPKLKMVLYILKDKGVSLENIQVFTGVVDPNMMRSTSYVTIVAPDLDRIIQVCDEDGNASYVFKLSSVSVDEVNHMTKKEKLDWINANPNQGVRLFSKSLWRENMDFYIFEDDFSKDSVPVLPDGVPNVEVGELDEWKGFWTDPKTGKHWGTRTSIVKKLDRTHMIFRHRLDGLESRTILDSHHRLQDGYCYEDFLSMFPELIGGNQVDKIGEWKGFWTDPKTGRHYGSAGTLMNKLDVNDWITVKKYIRRGGFESIKIRDVTGRLTDGYCFEDFLENDAFMDFKTAPEVNTEGDWVGFLIEDGKHWAPLGVLADRFNTTSTTLKAYAENFRLKSKSVKSRVKEIQQAYCLEDFESNVDFMSFVNLPRAEKSGEWVGFLIKNNKHFGTVFRISKKLSIQRAKVDQLIAHHPNIESVEMKDNMGKPFIGFCIEDIQERL